MRRYTRGHLNDRLPNVQYLKNLDLLDPVTVRREIESNIDLQGKHEIIFVHTVGKFKFELDKVPEVDNDSDGIDDEVLSSNVDTFKNVQTPFAEFAKQLGTVQEMTGVGFGSVSDKYRVPFWQSYTSSKDILRKHISGIARRSGQGVNCRGVFVNVSSINTRNESVLRPKANKTYWLEPDEIVQHTMPLIISPNARIRYVEADVFKPKPGFEPEKHYSEQVVLERWKREIGLGD